jgi:hypothetical protein
MWRIRWPDGEISPMGNLARAKDAARRFVLLGGTEVARWHRRETSSERAPAAVFELAST